MIIARLVADGLNLELFDDRKLQEEAVKMGIRFEDIKDIDDKAPGFFDLLFSKNPQIYLDYMEALVYELAKKGEGVIIGHGSQMLLRDFDCSLHVYIFADMSTRIKNLMDQKGLSKEAAQKLIRKNDNEQKGFFRFAFHGDWTDPSLYDLLINTEMLGIDMAAELIMEAARSEKVEACSLTAKETMENLSLKKRIEAVLLENSINLLSLHIEIPKKGVVQVNGFANTREGKKHILGTIKSVQGISEVQDDIGIIAYGV